MSIGIATFILIPAFPVAIGIGCLAVRRRWMAMGIMRWGLLGFCAVGLLLWWYDVTFEQHVLRQVGFDDYIFGVVWTQVDFAYVIALLMSFLSPWRRPKPRLHDSSG